MRRLLATLLCVMCTATACASSGGNHVSSSREGALRVRVALFGGPLGTDGQMALSNAPAAQQQVTVVAATGRRRYHGETQADGTFTLRLPPGRYTVSAECGGRRTATVTQGHTTNIDVSCAVP